MMAALTDDQLAEGLGALTANPARAAVFCDVDGTLAPIVERPDQARVADEVSRLLSRLGRRYACVACVSGRPATTARRLVGAAHVTYVGLHGAELLPAGEDRARMLPAVEGWEDPIRQFRIAQNTVRLRRLRIHIGDKGPIATFHWRGVPDEQAAREHLREVAKQAEWSGFRTHWGRKVLEIRPPTPIDKGASIHDLVARTGVRAALYGGDDATDLDAFQALDDLVARGALDSAVRVGVRSDEGPPAIVARADLVVDSVDGFVRVLHHLSLA